MAAPAQKSQLFSTSVVRKYTLAAPAQWSQLVSTSVINKVHFGRQTYKRSGSCLGRHGCHATGVTKWKSNRVRVSARAEHGCHARAQAKASEATLGIPLGSRSGRTRMPRKGLCGSHTVSTRQTLLHLAWPCQPARMQSRFSYTICRFLQRQPNCLDNWIWLWDSQTTGP